jgi:cysteine synthase
MAILPMASWLDHALSSAIDERLRLRRTPLPASPWTKYWEDRPVMRIDGNVLGAIGNTALVELRRVVPPCCAKIFVKIEGANPTGSMKDRMAQAMIAGAEKDGRLRAGDAIVEYTGGSTGASLALVCAAKGYRLRLVTSKAFSEDKLTQMAAFGAELTLIQSEGGLITKPLILGMIEAAREIVASHTPTGRTSSTMPTAF